MADMGTITLKDFGLTTDDFKLINPPSKCGGCKMLEMIRVIDEEPGQNIYFRCAMGDDYVEICTKPPKPPVVNLLPEYPDCSKCVHCLEQNKDNGVCLSLKHNHDTCVPCAGACSSAVIKDSIEAIKLQEKEKEEKRLSTPKCYEDCKNKDDIMNFLLWKYPLREEWGTLIDELEKVYIKRKKLWESIGVNDGFTFVEDVIIPKSVRDCLPSIEKCLGAGLITCELKRDFRKKYLHGGIWRVNFAPGAIISAAQRDNDLYRNIACFAYEGGYEGTSAQMVFDPNIAVLEPIDSNGIKKTGFQMVYVDSSGVHAYGGRYTGSDNSGSQASELAYKFANKINGEVVDNVEENNAAIDALCEIVAKTSDTRLDPKEMYAETSKNFSGKKVYSESDFDKLDDRKQYVYALWHCIEDVVESYEETRHYGGFFETGVDGCSTIYSVDEINDMICDKAGMFTDNYYNCDNCGDRFDVENSGYCGEEYGLGDQHFCCGECLEEAMQDACEEELDGVYLIDGALYSR